MVFFPADTQRPSHRLVLGFALLTYLLLAWGGLHYGLPNQDHILSYDCDETTWLEALASIKPYEGAFNPNPHPHLAHPTFYLEVYGAAVFLAAQTGWVPLHADKEWLRTHPDVFARFYLIGRYLQVVCGLVLLLMLWITAKTLYGSKAAIIATLLFSVTPALVAASHFSQASLPVTTLAFLSLACLLQDAPVECFHDRWLWGAALTGGLAISTKYSALPLVLPIMYQAFQKPPRWQRWVETVWILVAGFLIGSPFAVLAPRSFWAGFQHHAADNLYPIPGLFQKITFPFLSPFRYALGGWLEIVSVAGVLWLMRREKRNTLLLLWVGLFFAGTLMVGYIATPERVLIVCPALLLGVGGMVADWIEEGTIGTGTACVLFGFLYATTLLPSLALVTLRRQSPLQVQASQWIKQHIPPQATIGVPRTIYWWTPNIIYQSMTHPERLSNPYRVVDLKFSADAAQHVKPDFILLSDFERMNCLNWSLYAGACPDFLNWLDTGKHYTVVQRFPRDVHWWTWHWNRPERPSVSDDDLWTTSLTLYRRT